MVRSLIQIFCEIKTLLFHNYPLPLCKKNLFKVSRKILPFLQELGLKKPPFFMSARYDCFLYGGGIAREWIKFFIADVSIILETRPLICSANQWTGFCMIGTSVMKKLSFGEIFAIQYKQ